VRLEIGAIGIYRKALSPGVGYVAVCRYDTSCSAYALEALKRDGFWLGNLKMGTRLLCCSPFGWIYEKTTGKALYPHKLPVHEAVMEEDG